MYQTVEQYCAIRYGLEGGQKPTKSQRNTVSQMCRDGVLDAMKSGKRWLIWLDDRDKRVMAR